MKLKEIDSSDAPAGWDNSEASAYASGYNGALSDVRTELDKVVAQIEADIGDAKAKEDSNRAYGLYAQALEQQAHRGGLAAARVRLLALIEGNPS